MSTPTEQDPTTLIDLVCRKSRAVKSKTGRREISVSAQESRGRRTAAELGLTVRHVWREVGSASRFRTSKKTPQQDLALRALEDGEIGALWVFRLDRWTRRGAGAVLAIVEPRDGRPRRLLVDNNDPDNPGIALDSANPRDRSELIRRAEDAREETEVLSQRIRNTKTFQRDNGEWLNGVAPYGLRIVTVVVEGEDGEEVEERKLSRDTETSALWPDRPEVTKADLAREITYTLPLQGVAKRKIALLMNERGIASPTGGQWAVAQIHSMIGSPVYAGWQVAGRSDGKSRRLVYRNEDGERVSVMVGPSLLTQEEWDEANRVSRGVGPPLGSDNWKARHLLTDLLQCAGCGYGMTWRGTGYSCWRPGAGSVCLSPAFVAVKSAEEWVHARWSTRLHAAEETDPLLRIVAERWSARQDPEASADEADARAALAEAETALSRLWSDRRAGLYDGPSEGFFAPALRDANAAVVDAQARVKEAQGTRNLDIGFLLDYEEQDKAWRSADEPLRRDLLRLAIRKIVVKKAAYRGQKFHGPSRLCFEWLDGEVEEWEEAPRPKDTAR
ncbi:recombinase family protein [Nonomuraea guangzhouensis]|uniref:Recombinase family protein n=1 Tax=Nonomuraea guangzhouensis TaxID=1291555 RepID=A0ABW4GNC7_9ACTN|nr:recombinase family protein [Nonomuraea guangzhouensis]